MNDPHQREPSAEALTGFDVVEASDPLSVREEADGLGYTPFDPSAHPACGHCGAAPEAVRYVRHDGRAVRRLICSVCARLYD